MTRFLTLLIVFYLVYYFIKKFFSFFIHFSATSVNDRPQNSASKTHNFTQESNTQSTPYSQIEEAEFVELDETGSEIKGSGTKK